MNHQDRIKQRAHEIWEREGRPHGRDAEHWSRAEEELRDQQDDQNTSQTGDDKASDNGRDEPELERTIAPEPAKKRRRTTKTPPNSM